MEMNDIFLLQVASSALGYGPQLAMQLAERLYTQGFIRSLLLFLASLSSAIFVWNASLILILKKLLLKLIVRAFLTV